MKIKNILLITFLLLAVLTIGVVSASDEASLDNITVSDDTDDIIASEDDYDFDEHSIDIYGDYEDPIIIDEDDEEYNDEYEVATITLPGHITEGSFRVYNGKDLIAHSDIGFIDEDESVWFTDDGNLEGSILLKDFDLTKIKNGDILSFKFFECDNGNFHLIDGLTVNCTVKLTKSDLQLTEIDSEYENADVDPIYYIDEPVKMNDGWGDTIFAEFDVIDGLDGRIVIYLNETLSFNKTLSDVSGELDQYIINLGDLNITKPGTYIVTSYFYANDGIVKYNSTNDEEDSIIITLYEPQLESVGGVTIEVIGLPTVLNENDTLIILNSSANKGDEITVYVEGQKPISITINNNTRIDDEGNFIIGSKELNLPKVAREYVLNITYNGKNMTNKKISLISNVVITLEEEEIIYWKIDEGFVFIRLDDGEITTDENLEGKINLTIIDGEGNIICSYEEFIYNIQPSDDEEIDERIIFTKDLKSELNGTYKVIVKYFDGNEAETQVEGKVTFKKLTSNDYGASINPIIKNNNDQVIVFTNIPAIDDLIIEIDGKKVDDTLYLEELNNQEEKYYITYDKLKSLEDGPHTISAYIEINDEHIDILNETFIVDLKENIDPALTIKVENIEEGNDAIVLITTNNIFAGKVKVHVANVNYTANITNGQGNITIHGLKANTYNATVILISDGIFNDSIKTTIFNVTSKQVTPEGPANTVPTNPKHSQVKKANVIKLTLKKVKIKKSSKKIVLTATLKINGIKAKNKKIIFKFKGKTYKKKTNKKGVAKVIIKKKVLKKLKVGKKVTYTAKYSNKTVKRTVKVVK